MKGKEIQIEEEKAEEETEGKRRTRIGGIGVTC